MTRREIMSAWILGGGIWVLGLLGLSAVSLQSTEGSVSPENTAAAIYYVPSETSWLYQDSTGRYTTVVRGLRPITGS